MHRDMHADRKRERGKASDEDERKWKICKIHMWIPTLRSTCNEINFQHRKRNEMNASESENKTKTNNKRYFPMKLFATWDSRAKVPKILFKSIALAWRCIHLLSRHMNINENPLNRGKDNFRSFCITSNLRIPHKWTKKKNKRTEPKNY